MNMRFACFSLLASAALAAPAIACEPFDFVSDVITNTASGTYGGQICSRWSRKLRTP